jgi:prepilin-type N-terminal cleavage/methylation domain-containing protein
MLNNNQRIFGSRGFTLAELLITISIIGILTRIVLSSTAFANIRARDYSRISDIKTVQLYLGIYFSVNKLYPTTAAGLALLTSGGYASSLPIDPKSRLIYPYSYIVGQKYCLGTFLEDLANLPTDNAGCSLTTCVNPTTSATGQTCNYTVQR